jgi:RNA polymerase sigma-70 factor (ECF subfamily)
MRGTRAQKTVDVRALADEDLVPLMARGDARAFEAIYERHSGAAYSLAYRMVGARASAEDDRRRGSVRTWILGIVHHRAIDALRRASVHARRRSDDETAAERLAAPERVEEDVARRDEAAAVRAAIDRLPADQVKVIELAYFGGFTQVEIAGMLETPVGTVKGRMRLGLKRLHEALAHGAVGP